MNTGATGPSVLWYVGRGSGYVTLILLSASMALGVLTAVRWQSATWPRFLSQDVHRSISLLTLLFLGLHIVTVVVDPFAQLTFRDAVVPFGAAYRPLWTGLGVVAAELFVALIVTSLIRHRLGFRVWRAVHWAGYLCWPVALVHTLGTGTDVRPGWAMALNGICVATVAIAILWRLGVGWRRDSARRVGLTVTAGVVALAIFAWASSGPFQSGWARIAGTPAALLPTAAVAAGTATPPTSPSPAGTAAPAPLPGGLNDLLTGQLAGRADGSTTLTLQDQRDTSLQFTLSITTDNQQTAPLTITRDGVTICTTTATAANDGSLTAQCGGTALTLTLQSNGQRRLAGQVTTQGPR